MNMKRYLRKSALPDFSSEELCRPVRESEPFERIKAIYNYVRGKIPFGCNADDRIPASRVLADGYGQCNTKGALFMALPCACGAPCRVHGFTIHKSLQKGAMTGLVYRPSAENVFRSRVEVLLEDTWYEPKAY